jgi:16S rRNA (cytosine967-C5)-methyltransferase
MSEVIYTPVPLWRQLQGAASILMAVRQGQSMTAALERVDALLRPGVQSLAFQTLRRLGRADALRNELARRPPPVEADALLTVALALASIDEESAPYSSHALVDQAVEAAKNDAATRHQASFLNGCLRRFLRERAALMATTENLPQARWNHPQWWIDRLRKDHPAHWQAILQANNTQAPLVLRINRTKTTPAQYIEALAAMNIVASQIGEFGVVLANARPVPSLPGYAEGHFSVQDAAAQLAAPLLLDGLQPGPGQTRLNVLDACAAPGGKTGHLLELLGGIEADVTALDIDAQRCQRIEQNLARLGLPAHIAIGDAVKPAGWWDGRLFDGILLDAPCTASGIVRRHPDVRWLRRPTDIPRLAALQMRLLEALWPLVRPGGRLVYCTCSVFLAEGDNQIQTFVTHHKDAALSPSPGHLLPASRSEGTAMLDNLNGEHDGFFYATLQKSSS